MEAGWDRASPFVALTEAEVQAMFAPIGATVRTVTPLSSGLANTNYRVELQDGCSIVLRLYTRSPEVITTELAVLLLVKADLPVAEVLFADIEGEGTRGRDALTRSRPGSKAPRWRRSWQSGTKRGSGRSAGPPAQCWLACRRTASTHPASSSRTAA